VTDSGSSQKKVEHECLILPPHQPAFLFCLGCSGGLARALEWAKSAPPEQAGPSIVFLSPG
jgi:hypothetical protein